MSKEKVITDPDKFVFSIDDCQINVPVNPRTGRSYRIGPSNGEHAPTVDGSRSARSVTVTHIPTGLSVTKDQFLAYRNKELAIRELEGLVNEWIKARKPSQEEV